MPREIPVSLNTLSSELASKVDALIRRFSETPVMKETARKCLADKVMSVAVAKMLDEGLTYGQASGAPDFLNLDEKSFRDFMKIVDQDLGWQCGTVAAAFEKFRKTGEVPAPYYPMRVAILLRKAKDSDREKQFLAGWCRHFPSGNGAKYGALVQRARKIGAIGPSR